MANITITTRDKRQVIDITGLIEKTLVGDGLANLFLVHTTAAITTADLDPGTDEDILKAFSLLTPKGQWNHPHNPEHFPDHLFSTIVGTSLTIPFKDSKFLVGSWQRVILIEFDGPKQREIILTMAAS